MAGPWEKYASQTPAAPAGPWTKYGASPSEPAQFDGSAEQADLQGQLNARAARMTARDVDGAPTTSSGGAFLRGTAQGATSAAGDEMAGASAASPIPGSSANRNLTLGSMNIVDTIAGGTRIGLEKLFPGTFGTAGQETYTQERDRIRAANEKAQADAPGSYLAGQIAGGIAGTAPVASGAGAAMAARGLGGRIAISGATGAGLGAIQGAGDAKEMADIPSEAAKGAIVGGGVCAAVPLAGAALRKAVSPNTIAPERQALIQTLEKEGIPLTAGQRTGSRGIQYAEASAGDMLGSGGRASAIQQEQGRKFTSAVLQRMGINSELATPDALDAGVRRISQQFEDLSARNIMKADNAFGGELSAVQATYEKLIPQAMRSPVVTETIDALKQAPVLAGESYQAVRSQLDKQARSVVNSNPPLSEALFGIRNAMDKAMGRSISGADKAAWQEARDQWAVWKTVQRAATGAGSDAAQGIISPSALRNAVATANRSQYARGLSKLSALARAGEAIMKPLPNSGTAGRVNMGGLATMISGGTAGGVLGGPAGAVAGAVGAPLAGRLLMSRPVQAYLSNQVATGPGTQSLATLGQSAVGVPARALLNGLY